MNIDNEVIRPIDGVCKSLLPTIASPILTHFQVLNNKGRIALDPIVHNLDTTGGAYHVLIYPFVAALVVRSEAQQTAIELGSAKDWYLRAIPGKWVQDSNGLLRHLDEDGVIQPNGLRLCGVESSVYGFWWDDVPYMNCPVAEFKIVPL